MLVEELVNTHVAASYSDQYLAFFDADIDSFAAKFVDTCAFPHKHHLKFATVRVVVDELCHLMIDSIIFQRHIDRHSSLQLYDIVLQGRIL